MSESTPHTLDRLDELMAGIARDQVTLSQVVTESLAEHQAVDDKFTPRINPLARSIQERFDEAKRISEAHRIEILPRGKKSSGRATGTVGWRAVTELLELVDQPELIRRIKALGPTVSRKFLRRRVTWELRADNMKAPENAQIIAGLDGVEVRSLDAFFIDPRNGFRMSSTKNWWPSFDGMKAHDILKVIFEDRT